MGSTSNLQDAGERDNRIYKRSDDSLQWTYEYDKEGRIQKRESVSIEILPVIGVGVNGITTTDTTTDTFAWDARGRLRSVTRTFTHKVESSVLSSSQEKVEYIYDALNRRIGRIETVFTQPGGVPNTQVPIATVFDATGEAMEVQLGSPSGNNNLLRHNFRGPGRAGLLAVDQASATGPTRTVWTFADAAGTVTTTAWFDEGASQWQRYQRQFDGRGNITKTGGDAEPALQQVPVVWRGLRQDEFSDLYLAGLSVFDPQQNRYLSQASTGDANPYRFEGNRPTSPDPAFVSTGEAADSRGIIDGAYNLIAQNPRGAIHLGLDLLGAVPVIGAPFDAANAALFLSEGDRENAALSGIAAIPGLGYLAGFAQGAKYLRRADIAANVVISSYLGVQGVRDGNPLQVGVAVLGLGINAAAIRRGALNAPKGTTFGHNTVDTTQQTTIRVTQFFDLKRGNFGPGATEALTSPPNIGIARFIDGPLTGTPTPRTHVSPFPVSQQNTFTRLFTGRGTSRNFVEFDVLAGNLQPIGGFKGIFGLGRFQQFVPDSVSLFGANATFGTLAPNYGQYAIYAGLGISGGYVVYEAFDND